MEKWIRQWKNVCDNGKMDLTIEKWICQWKNGCNNGKMDSPLENGSAMKKRKLEAPNLTVVLPRKRRRKYFD